MSMMDCIRLTWKEEGFRGFYKGMQSPLAGEGFFNAVQFFMYGASKRALLERTGDFDASLTGRPHTAAPLHSAPRRTELSVAESYLAGALTGFASTFIEAPIDLWKSQLQTQIFRAQPAFSTFPGCVMYIWRANGVRGCFQGMGATFLRTVPATSAFFGTYELVKQKLCRPGQLKSELGVAQLLLSGGCGGLAYWLSCFPADSVKSAMQSDAVFRHERQYRTIVDTTRQFWREGGIRRFYRGLAPALLRSFPANAVCLLSYEKSLEFMHAL